MSWSNYLQKLGLDLNQPDSWWQFIAVLAVVLVVAGLNYFIGNSFDRRISAAGDGVRKITLNSIERIIAPLIALVLFIIISLAFAAQEWPRGLLKSAAVLAVVLAGTRVLIYGLRKTFPVTPLLKTWENIFVLIAWGMFALYYLDWLNPTIELLDGVAIHFGKTKISLLVAVKTVLIVSIFVMLAIWISAFIERRLKQNKHIASYLQIGISKTIRVIAIIIAFIISLEIIGVDLTTLTVLGGALGVGIGFGLQRIASNFISGFILLFDRSIRPHDVISIGNSFGWVKELRARYVVIKDRDGVETLIPNENLITSQVINWSYTDKAVRIKSPVTISYGDDPELAMKLMVEAATENKRVLNNPETVARLMAFGDNGIELELRFWITDPEEGVNNIRSDVNLQIWRKFKANHITIPFPQRDVHMIPGGDVPKAN